MLVSYIFILVTSFIVICECGYNEKEYGENLCEARISADLIIMQKEIFEKLEAIDKKISDTNRKFDTLEKIPATLNEMQNKLHTMENLINESEENSHVKFRKLEKYILDNIDDKLGSTEKYINRKIDGLENLMPDKLDIKILNRKLDIFIKNQLGDVHAISKSMLNETVNDGKKQNSETTEENTGSSNSSFEELNKKVSIIETNFNSKLTELKDMIPVLSENITSKLLALDTKVQTNSEKNNAGCNKVVVVHYDEYKPLFRMDKETFKYITFRSDSEGLTYFEMHLAIKAATNGIINLSSGPDPGTITEAFEIDVGGRSNTRTHMHLNGTNRIEASTPQILSATEFTAFYVKINNGTLEFGKEHNGTILSYSDVRLKTLKFFSFSTFAAEGATFLYDCPPNFEMLATPCYGIK